MVRRSFGPKRPTNPLLAIADLEAIAEICAEQHIPWFCDNTFATPIAQNPLDYGAAGSMHSVTKYIGGHSDLILGAVAVNDPELAKRLRGRRGDVGTQPDGFTCWLARRGSQTLAVRFQRQCENAMELATRLQAHPAVEHVFYPGLPSHPGHEIAKKQMRGYFGAMLSFIAKGGQDAAQRVVDRCEIFVTATSLGGVESLIERRARWTAESAHPALLRLSIGIEDVDDLWRDLEQSTKELASDREARSDSSRVAQSEALCCHAVMCSHFATPRSNSSPPVLSSNGYGFGSIWPIVRSFSKGFSHRAYVTPVRPDTCGPRRTMSRSSVIS